MINRLLLTAICTALFLTPLHAATSAVADWTLIIFMSSDNDLSAAAIDDIDEMIKVGSTERVNVVVLRDSIDPDTHTKVYHIQKKKAVVIKDFGSNIDTGNWHELVDLFKLAQEQYPAQKYMVTVWNHGNGWEKNAKSKLEKGIAYDDNSGNNISTKQLGEALKEMAALRGKKIELFSTDACLMQMVEVAYEFKDYADYFAASEEVEPGQGWPYTEILNAVTKRPEMGALELGQNIARLYVESYKNGSQEGDLATFSVVSLPELSLAVDTLPALVNSLSNLGTLRPRFFDNLKYSQSYDAPEYVDLLDFISNVRPVLSKNLPATEALNKAEAAFSRAIKYEVHWGSDVKKSRGISIWLPKEKIPEGFLDDYKTLQFEKRVNWTKLIDSYLL